MITMNKNIYFYEHKSGLSTIHANLTVVSTFSGGVLSVRGHLCGL